MAQVPGWQFAAVNFQRRFARDSGLIRIDEVDVAQCHGLGQRPTLDSPRLLFTIPAAWVIVSRLL